MNFESCLFIYIYDNQKLLRHSLCVTSVHIDESGWVVCLHWGKIKLTDDFDPVLMNSRTSQLALVVKKPPVNAGDIRDAGSLGQEDPLEEAMATHSSFLAWRIPGTEEPGGLQAVGSQSQTWLRLSIAQHRRTAVCKLQKEELPFKPFYSKADWFL